MKFGMANKRTIVNRLVCHAVHGNNARLAITKNKTRVLIYQGKAMNVPTALYSISHNF